jgi:hypothetical protein
MGVAAAVAPAAAAGVGWSLLLLMGLGALGRYLPVPALLLLLLPPRLLLKQPPPPGLILSLLLMRAWLWINSSRGSVVVAVAYLCSCVRVCVEMDGVDQGLGFARASVCLSLALAEPSSLTRLIRLRLDG